MSKAISAHGIRLIGMFAGVAVTMLVPLSAADDLRLIDAAKSRNIEAVSAVLKTHADVNARQRDGATALHWAAHFDDVAMAELLIRAGARRDWLTIPASRQSTSPARTGAGRWCSRFSPRAPIPTPRF